MTPPAVHGGTPILATGGISLMTAGILPGMLPLLHPPCTLDRCIPTSTQ
jgi:hypothetical protein